MKKLLLLLILLIMGLAIGGGAAFGVSHFMGPPPSREQIAAQHAAAAKPETTFIPAGTLLVPIVTQEGDLSGYANFDVQLEVDISKADSVTTRLPLLLHAINLRAWQTPMAAGPGYMLPDLRTFATLVEQSARASLGKDAIVRAVVTGAKPV